MSQGAPQGASQRGPQRGAAPQVVGEPIAGVRGRVLGCILSKRYHEARRTYTYRVRWYVDAVGGNLCDTSELASNVVDPELVAAYERLQARVQQDPRLAQ